MQHALPYIVLVILYGGLAVIYHQTEDARKRSHLEIACITIFLFFFGLRGFVFYDWLGYYPNFYAVPDITDFSTADLTRWYSEPGLVLLMSLCKTLFPNYHFFVFVCTTINLILLLRFFRRYSDNLPLGFVLFLCFNGIVISTDLMRNSISLLLYINSLEYIEERRPIPFFAINLLGLIFHKTALLFLPLYFMINRKWNKWIVVVIFIVANGMFLLHIPILKSIISVIANFVDPSIKLYFDIYTKIDIGKSVAFGIGIGYLERLFTSLLIICYIDKLRSIRPANNIFINSVILYLVLFLVFSEFRTVSTRLSLIFSYGYWIIWADLIKCITFRNNRLLFVAYIGIYCILRVYGSCNFALADYENIVLGSQSYNERLLIFRQHFNDKTGI